MSATIISALPGAGKSTAIKQLNDEGFTVSDSDSRDYNFLMKDGNYIDYDGNVVTDKDKRIKHPDFPDNYITEILKRTRDHDYVFVLSHQEVREALDKKDIPYVFVTYERSMLSEVVSRIMTRNNGKGIDPIIAEVVKSEWGDWMDEADRLECEDTDDTVLSYIPGEPINVRLSTGQFMADVIDALREAEDLFSCFGLDFDNIDLDLFERTPNMPVSEQRYPDLGDKRLNDEKIKAVKTDKNTDTGYTVSVDTDQVTITDTSNDE